MSKTDTDTDTADVPRLGTFVLAEMGRAAVVVGDVRDIVDSIGKTVTVHADGETRRVKLSEQWHSARHGGTYFPLYRETGEVKRNGEPKRVRTDYRIGAAIVGNVNAEPMTFADAMLYLNAAHHAGASDTDTASKSTRGKSTDTADTDTAPPAPDSIATTVAMLIAGGMSPTDAAAVGVAMRADAASKSTDTAAPASKSTGSKSTRGKSTGTRSKSTGTRRGSKSTADSVDAMLSEL